MTIKKVSSIISMQVFLSILHIMIFFSSNRFTILQKVDTQHLTLTIV